MKIMELFHVIGVKEAQEWYDTNNICCLFMAEWDRLHICCSNNLPVTVREKPEEGNMELCLLSGLSFNGVHSSSILQDSCTLALCS